MNIENLIESFSEFKEVKYKPRNNDEYLGGCFQIGIGQKI